MKCYVRHGDCHSSPRYSKHARLDLRLSRVSKHTLCSTGVFSFTKAEDLEWFAKSLLPEQIRALRALHLDITLDLHLEAIKWRDTTASSRLFSSRLDLESRTLHVCIEQKFYHMEDIAPS